MLYHRYEGGGVTIHGPSVLVRKKMAEKYSVSANYYMDMVTSASIDVEVSGASEYKEERDQYSLGFDYLRGKTTYSLSYSNSKENDYEASTASFGLSQDLFGDLTTISMGFSKGADTVRRTISDPNNPTARIVDPSFEEDLDRWSYRVGVSQILTKSLIATLGLETITDEGYLNNPYRSFRYVDPSDTTNFRLATEKYPHTRTSNAVALNARYFLPWRAAAFGGYRFFTDTWGIRANTSEVGYMHPLKGLPLDAGGELPLLPAGSCRFLLRPVPAHRLPELHGTRQGAVDVQQHDAAPRRDLRVPARRLEVHQERHDERVLRSNGVQLRRFPRCSRCRPDRRRRNRCTSSVRTCIRCSCRSGSRALRCRSATGRLVSWQLANPEDTWSGTAH